MIIFRYLTKEVSATLTTVTGVLLVIFLSNQLVRYLAQAATGKMGGFIALRIMLIEIPHFLGILLPLGLFIGILLSFGRLYADNEMTVFHACGLSQTRLVTLLLPVTGAVFLLVSLLNLWLTPHLLAYRDELMAQTGTAMELQTTLPGRFQSTEGGKRVFYVESMSPDRQHMSNIFMAQLPNKAENAKIPNWVIMSAEKGYQTIDRKTGDRFFVSENGYRYQGIPGSKDYQIVHYQTYGVRIENQVADISGIQETLPTMTLLKNSKEEKIKNEAIAELQWRLAMPIATLLLPLLAVPFSRLKPRQGRYRNLLPAILIYIIYANLLLMGRSWIENQTLSSGLGMWWIHLLLLIAIWLTWFGQTYWSYCKAFLKRKFP